VLQKFRLLVALTSNICIKAVFGNNLRRYVQPKTHLTVFKVPSSTMHSHNMAAVMPSQCDRKDSTKYKGENMTTAESLDNRRIFTNHAQPQHGGSNNFKNL